jgi:putative RNA 2'-phosphotransferase
MREYQGRNATGIPALVCPHWPAGYNSSLSQDWPAGYNSSLSQVVRFGADGDQHMTRRAITSMDRSLVRTSKFLSLVLRHRPEAIGLTLDENGWADIEELLVAAKQSGHRLNRALLLRVVKENDKRRFAFSEDKTKIRASQGHSIDVDLELQPSEPPELLYHGTVRGFLASIMQQGLQSGTRQHVHLSPDRKTATTVGQRRGSPVILTIESAAMHTDGYEFYLSANGVWLTDEVPVRYIRFPGS